MSMISRVGQSVVRNGAKAAAKYLKVAPTTTKTVHGIPVKTNHITGTQVAKFPDGDKTIVLGAKNRLSKLFGEGATIVSYSNGPGKDRLITIKGKDVPGLGLPFLPKEFGEFVKMMQELAKVK